MSDKKSILILGGTGFIGRNMVKFLVDCDLCSRIVVADKSLPATSYFAPMHQAAFANKDLVQFKQADLNQDAHLKRVFDAESKFDIVINLCGETRFGLADNDYKVKIVETAAKASAAAHAAGVQMWVEVSTAQVYKSDKKPSNEKATIKPWTKLAAYRHEAESVIASSGLNHVILRPATVYGEGDLCGLTPRLTVGACYKRLGEKCIFLWGGDLGLCSVHVEDCCAAIWTACSGEIPSGSVYNVADQAGLTQNMMNGFLSELFGIEVGYYGVLVSNLAKTKLTEVAETANDKHVPCWTQMCQESKVNTPVSPYIDKELLYNNSLAVDGTAIAQNTSFNYKHPKITAELLKRVVQTFEAQGAWPPGTLV